jgi:hypothetical protein
MWCPGSAWNLNVVCAKLCWLVHSCRRYAHSCTLRVCVCVCVCVCVYVRKYVRTYAQRKTHRQTDRQTDTRTHMNKYLVHTNVRAHARTHAYTHAHKLDHYTCAYQWHEYADIATDIQMTGGMSRVLQGLVRKGSSQKQESVSASDVSTGDQAVGNTKMPDGSAQNRRQSRRGGCIQLMT